MTQKYEGRILSYDPSNRTGQVEISGVHVVFHSTCFYSGRVTRQPRNGEAVSVALSSEPEHATLRDVHGVWVR